MCDVTANAADTARRQRLGVHVALHAARILRHRVVVVRAGEYQVRAVGHARADGQAFSLFRRDAVQAGIGAETTWMTAVRESGRLATEID